MFMQHSFTPSLTASAHQGCFRMIVRCAGIACVASCLASCGDDHPKYSFHPYDVPNSVVIADMDGDGVNDLAVAYTHVTGNDPNAGYAGVILQNLSTPGTFKTSVDTAVGDNPAILAVGDLDATSDQDLVVANALSGNVSVLLQSSTQGQLQTAMNINTGGVPYDVAIGDLNNDGLNDLAVADASGNDVVWVILQNSASPGSYLTPTSLQTGNPSTAVAIGDLNGDDLPDLVVTSYDTSGNNGKVSVFLQDSANPGTFLTRSDYAAGAQPLSVRLADLNADGRPDLVIANYGPGTDGSGAAGVSVLLQNAAAPGEFLAPVTYATAHGAVCATVGDLNHDGLPDLAVANLGGSHSGSVSVLLQDATRPGVFLSPTNYAGVYEPLSVAIGDLNQDGYNDIAVADGNRATVMLQSSASPGTFANAVMVGD